MDGQDLSVNSKVTCPRCGNGIYQGGGHGDRFGFQHSYCLVCDEFIEWNSFGMDVQKTQGIQDYLRGIFKSKQQSQ